MKKITIPLESTSALKLSEYRKFAKTWKPDPVLSAIFKRISKGKSKYRVYVSPSKGVIDLNAKIPTFIERHVKEKGYTIDQLNYVRGYAIDKHGRQVKLGKVLSDRPDYLDMFVKHEARKRDLQVLEREDYVLAISHHAYDIIGASTDRGWTSCTDLRGDYAATAPTRIKPEVDNRSIIAYLVKKDDTNIEKPLARALAKRFVSDAGSERYILDAIYPNRNAILLKTFQNWLDRNINKHLPNVPHDFTIYSLPTNQYKDGHSNTDGEEGVSKKATGENLENLFRRLPTGIPSTQNLLAFMLKYHSNPTVLNTIQRSDEYRTKLISKIMRMRLTISRDDSDANRLLKLKRIDYFLANLLEGMYGGKYPLVIALFLKKAGKNVPYIELCDEEFDRISRYLGDDLDAKETDRPKSYPVGASALTFIENGFKVFYGDKAKGSNVVVMDDEDNIQILRSLFADLENKSDFLNSCFVKTVSELHRDLMYACIREWFDYVPWEKIYRYLDRASTLITTLTLLGNIKVDNYFTNKNIPQEILMAISLLRMMNIRDIPHDIPLFCRVIERVETLLANGTVSDYNVNYLYRVVSMSKRVRFVSQEEAKLLQDTVNNCPNILREFTLEDEDA